MAAGFDTQDQSRFVNPSGSHTELVQRYRNLDRGEECAYCPKREVESHLGSAQLDPLELANFIRWLAILATTTCRGKINPNSVWRSAISCCYSRSECYMLEKKDRNRDDKLKCILDIMPDEALA